MRRNDESSPVWSEQQRCKAVQRQKIRAKLFAKPFGAQVLLDILHVDAERGRCPFVEDWELQQVQYLISPPVCEDRDRVVSNLRCRSTVPNRERRCTRQCCHGRQAPCSSSRSIDRKIDSASYAPTIGEPLGDVRVDHRPQGPES